MSKSRYLFSYAPNGVDESTSFYWVFLSESRKDRQLRERLSGISRQCPDFLFVKYNAHWHDFVIKLFENLHPHACRSCAHAIIKTLSSDFIRHNVAMIPSANPSNVKNLSQLLSV